MHPGQHRLGDFGIEELAVNEQPEDAAAEGLDEDIERVQGQGDEGAVGAEAAVGDERVDVRLPVYERAVRLDRQGDAN